MSCGTGPLCHHQADCTDVNCPGRPVAVVRSCEELGLCQSRAPRCADCRLVEHYPFAPGVIEGPYPNERQTKALQKWLLRSAALMGLLALLAFVAGYLS